MAAGSSTSIVLPPQQPYIEGRSFGLHDFPNEIITNIAQRILHAESLLSLALCSRHLYTLTEPILYAEFSETGGHSYSLALFLRRLLVRPDLARCVTRFKSMVKECADEFLSEFNEEDWARTEVAVGAASINEAQGALWVRAIKVADWNAIAALFLCVTPNLQEIVLSKWMKSSFSFANENGAFLEQVFERAATLQDNPERPNAPFSLSSLKRVSLDFTDAQDKTSNDGGDGDFKRLELFWKLKSVTKLRGITINDTDGTVEFTAPPPRSFWTKDLTLIDSILTLGDTENLFPAFKSLERLYFKQGPTTLGQIAFIPPLFMQDLEALKHSLEDLTIITLHPVKGFNKFENHPIGSFASFPKLTSIDILSYHLIGEPSEDSDIDGLAVFEEAVFKSKFPRHQRLVDALPSSLRHLSLRYVQPQHVQHIFDLISQKAEKTPYLETLDLHWEGVTYPDKPSPKEPIIHPGFTASQAAEMKVQCDAAGVKIAMEYPPPKPKYVSFPRKLKRKEKSDGLGEYWGPMVTETMTFHYPYYGMEELCQALIDHKRGIRPKNVDTPFLVTHTNVFQHPYEGFRELCRDYGFTAFGEIFRERGYIFAQAGLWLSM